MSYGRREQEPKRPEVTTRMPRALRDQIHEQVDEDDAYDSVNAWMIDAAREKLARDNPSAAKRAGVSQRFGVERQELLELASAMAVRMFREMQQLDNEIDNNTTRPSKEVAAA